MSFGGHINDMVNRIKQNAALKDSSRRNFKGGNDYSHISSNKTDYNFPKLSKEEMEKFKTKIKTEAKLEKRKQIKFWLLALVLPIIIAFLIFNYF